MLRARKAGVPTPVLYCVEAESASIYMERIDGRSIRHLLHDGLLDAAGGCSAGAATSRCGARRPHGGTRDRPRLLQAPRSSTSPPPAAQALTAASHQTVHTAPPPPCSPSSQPAAA